MKFAFLSLPEKEPDPEQLKTCSTLALDVELDNNNPVGISLSYEPTSGYYFPWENLPKELLSRKITYIGHNIGFDYSILKRYGITLSKFEDTLLIAHLLENKKLSLKSLVNAYLGNNIQDYDEFTERGKKKDLSQEQWAEYSIPHSIYTLTLWNTLLPLIKNKNLYYSILLPLIPVLSDMEQCGIAIDENVLFQLETEFRKIEQTLITGLNYWGGKEINWNSPEQVGKLLLDLGLPLTKRTPKKKLPSTREEDLIPIKHTHPVIGLLIQYKKIQKLIGTYIQGLKQYINQGRIHTNFSQVSTPTGRLSSSEPNIMNIPARTELGKKIRCCFIPSPGNILIGVDFDQLELRILAHFSQDKNLIESFNKGKDIHLETATRLSSERFIGKTLNFVVPYGGGEELISSISGIPIEEARKWKKEYFQLYSGLYAWIQKTRKKAKEMGYVETLYGRRRTFHQFQNKEELESVNTIIQGSAAEIVQLKMIEIWNQMKGMESKMILQCHDELLFDVPVKEKEELINLIKKILPYKDLSIPLPVTIKVGNNWGKMELI